MRFLIGLIAAFLILLLANIPLLSGSVQRVLDAFVVPLGVAANQVGVNFKDSYSAVTELNVIKSRLFELEAENAKIRSENDAVVLLRDENSALKEQLKIVDREYELVQVPVLRGGIDEGSDEVLIIGGGSDLGLENNQVVILGEIYVGRLFDVSPKLSKVRLATSRSSSLESAIKKADGQEFNALAAGRNGAVVMENINTVANVATGDLVIVKDEKVGEFLVLGTVGKITEEPSLTSKSAQVLLPIEYDRLTFIYVVRN